MYESLSLFHGKPATEIHKILKALDKKELRQLESLLVYQEKHQTPPLKQFIKEAWSAVETKKYVDNWHIDAICLHLEAVTIGEIQNLVINMPPRHMKSMIVCVFWPIWVWLKRPEKQFLFSSYGKDLSTRDSQKCRRLISSKWFQDNYGDRFQLSKDQNQKTRFENNKTGVRIATSVDGVGTGENANFIVCDDPHKVTKAGSIVVNASTLEWWDTSMSTRLIDPEEDGKVIVMQPVSERDLSAHVLEQGGYEHLILPCEYYDTGKITSLGWKDPRTEEGELLWPHRFGKKAIDEWKLRLGKYGFATQFQMERAPKGGGIVKEAWWRFFEAEYDQNFRIITPKFDRIIVSMDTAFKDGELNDYSSIQFWGINNTGAYLFHLVKKKMDFPTLLKRTIDECSKIPINALIIEDAASGQSLIQTLEKQSRLPVIPIKVDSSKESRLKSVSTFIESGRVFLLKGSNWLTDFTHEIQTFPNAAHDDQVDAMTQALNYIFLHSSGKVVKNISIMGR